MAAKKKVTKKKATKKKTVKKKVAKKKAPVKKKTVKKKNAPVKKKSVAKKKPMKKSAPVRTKKTRASPRKFRIVVKNLILFLILSLSSYLLHLISDNPLFSDFFLILFWILGIIFLAFFIMLLILVFLRSFNK